MNAPDEAKFREGESRNLVVLTDLQRPSRPCGRGRIAEADTVFRRFWSLEFANTSGVFL